MKTLPYQRTSYCVLFLLQALGQAVETPKLLNTLPLNNAGSWNNGVIPGVNDVMLWNSIYNDGFGTGALSPMGQDFSVQGIKVTNVGGDRNLTGKLCGFTSPGSAQTLTIGSGGIDMSTALQALYMQPRVIIGADQTWSIADANTNGNAAGFNNNEDLAFAALALGTPFNLNGKTVNTTGNGYITLSNGYSITNGTINAAVNLFVLQGGASTLMTVGSDVNLGVSSGRLRLQSQSGGINSAATISATGTGTLEMRTNNTQAINQTGNVSLASGTAIAYLMDNTGLITHSGGLAINGSATMRVSGGNTNAAGMNFSGALTGSAPLAFQNTGTNVSGNANPRWTGNNSGYSGTITLNGASGNRHLRLASATAGSAAATWNIGTTNILQVDGVSVQLGNLQGSGTITNSHATLPATLNIGAGNFTGNIINGLAAPALVGITKVGTGTAVLSGPNNFTGPTSVIEGTLTLTPDSVAIGTVGVASGATFSTMLKTDASSLTTANLTVDAGGTLQLDYTNLPGNPTAEALAVDTLRFNGPTAAVKIVGKNLTAGSFPLLQYDTLDGASTAINAIALKLPTRTTGALTDTGLGVTLNIATTEQVKWGGTPSGDWDIDPDGSGAVGTPNWKTTGGGLATRYIQGAIGSDVVTFDDTAGGSGTINLTATLTPGGITFNNSSKDYVFTGSGKLSGVTSLDKNGTASVTLANTTANDYSGGTTITAGTLKLGDGVTAGAGVIAGTVANDGTLVLNRPDNHDLVITLTGAGTLEKAQANTVTIPGAVTMDGALALTGGRLKFSGGGALNGVISGAGELEAAGGIMVIAGATANTNTGLTNVSAGTLRLQKAEATNALAGNIDITGGGVLAILANEQIANTATIRALGTSADSLAGSTGTETFANAVVNGVATTQLILRNNSVVTGTGTVSAGILGVASAHTASVGGLVLTSPTAMVRIAANTGPSTMNVGAGGITASNGEIQVKFSGGLGANDGVMNLAGDVTTTGDVSFTNGGYTGPNLNVINLSGSRIFNIGAGSTTTVAPDITNANVGETLTKSGDGTLTLTPANVTTIPGGSTVSAGSLLVNGAIISNLQVNAAGTIGGSGTITGAVTVDGAVSPGAAAAVGNLTAAGAVTLAPGSDLNIGVGVWNNVTPTPGTDWDHLTASSLALTATAGNKLVIHVSGTPTGFAEANKTITIATSTAAITGFDVNAIQIDSAGFSGSGTWTAQLGAGNTSLELVYTAGAGSPYSSWAAGEGLDGTNNGQTANPDNDGDTNVVEFALAGEPLNGLNDRHLGSKIATVGADQVLTLTLAVRDTGGNPTAFTGGTEQVATVDGVEYRIQGGNDLGGWTTLVISEVTGPDATAIQSTMPNNLPAGWRYRTFRTPGPVSADSKEFIRAKITGTP